jgi:3-oxoacyl-[acyl-carrier protein] reductase
MELGLKNRVVAITGGGSGIGKAAAFEFLKEGCRVAICGRTLSKLEAAKKEAQASGYDLLIASVDVKDEKALAAFAENVVRTYGRLDVWVNNAGANQIKSLMDYSVEEFRAMTDGLFVSTFAGSKIAASYMKKQQSGVILNASSFSAVIPNAGRAPYSACKAAVSSLTRTFAAELAPDHIRVVAYVPGMIATEISRKNIELNGKQLMSAIPMQRFGTAEDIASVIVFLASDRASYINGVDIPITGGKLCVQNPLYAY